MLQHREGGGAAAAQGTAIAWRHVAATRQATGLQTLTCLLGQFERMAL